MALCIGAKIDCLHWMPGSGDHAFGDVIVVSVEHNLLPEFISYCTRWVSTDLISRLFIDNDGVPLARELSFSQGPFRSCALLKARVQLQACA